MQPRHHHVNVPNIVVEGTVAAGFHRIAYTEWGEQENKNILVCVHGLTRNSRDFDLLAGALQQQYRILCVDIAGRGQSQWLDEASAYNYNTYVADVLALLTHLQISQVDWVGTSMGGLIGMLLAASHPGLIHKLVLNDIGPFIPAATLKRIGRYVAATPEFTDLIDAEKHLRTILAPFAITSAAHWQHITEHSVMHNAQGKWILAYDPAIAKIFQQGSNGEEMKDIDLWGVWQHVSCPVLVLRGAISDALLAETAAQMQVNKPSVTLVEFAGIGHAPALMEEVQINVVKKWLIT